MRLPASALGLIGLLAASACGGSGAWTSAGPPAEPSIPALANVIPRPQSVTPAGGSFALLAGARIQVQAGNAEIAGIARYLAERLNASTGLGVAVLAASGPPRSGGFHLARANDASLGEEGYLLTIAPDPVTLEAFRPAGLFRGVQTIRQLLPAAVESAQPQPGPWTMPATPNTRRWCRVTA